jgi:carbon-monoxide dehydrogenase medium subunit
VKPAPFDYARPASLEEAGRLLAREDVVAKALAGGQSLGPMLNLRLAQPELLVDITRIPELQRVEEADSAVVVGACVTHSAIEDGCVGGATGAVLAEVAHGVAYRAVRNRGTLGGSLVHADPAADWVACLAALGGEALVWGPAGRRAVPVEEFVTGAFEVDLAPSEILEGVRVPTLSPDARWGYYKFCRKTGEFAEAIGALLHDPARGILRAVVGATHGAPLVLADASELFGPDAVRAGRGNLERAAVARVVAGAGLGDDAYLQQIHRVALERAVAQLP